VAKLIAAMTSSNQRNFRKTLRSLMEFAIEEGLREDDPTVGVKIAAQAKSDGWYTWTEDDIAKYEARHSVGTMARFALAIMLYAGLRLGDAARFGPPHIRNGKLDFVCGKTRKSSGVKLQFRVHPELARIIAATPHGIATFLLNDFGKRFATDSLGNKMRKWCDEAGLEQCTAHGLRKAIAVRLVAMRATPFEIAAVLGHTTTRQAEEYVKKFDREQAGDTGMDLLDAKGR
jgi:integrase